MVNAEHSHRYSGLSEGSEGDSEALRILDSYLAGIEAGRPADHDQLLADHPGLSDRLRVYLKVMQLAGRLVEDSAARAEAGPDGPSAAGRALLGSCGSEGWGERTPAAGWSQMSTFDLGPVPPPQVHLREPLEDCDPAVGAGSAEMPNPVGIKLGRYQLEGEIARGGMGAIIRGRDVDLGRELAIKVLLESHQANPEVVRRFVEEAQIGGQLQHPGVVPVYELGTFPDRRPYFAMKLVKGRTLAALFRERTSPSQDLPRFLGIFEQSCYTMAYAHARGVVHRDLKPSNVMVGSFGEVQVMDWGLAKVLSRGGIADEAATQAVQEAVITTVRSGPTAVEGESQAGSILGTPAYMAPEQARGEVERIDERADVFGLGAILCEILTLMPPYFGSNREELRARAARGDLDDALARLDASGVDLELIGLARSCLAADPEHRPRSAGELARRLTACQEGVRERLRAAEWARVEAQARAEEQVERRLVADQLAREAGAREQEERKRRRLTVALAASLLITAGVIGGGWAFQERQRNMRLAATTRVVTEALADAERSRGRAQSAALGNLADWTEALAAARRARALLVQGEAEDALSVRVGNVLGDLEREQAGAVRRAAEVEQDRALLARLEGIRGNRSEHWDPKQTDADYDVAFRQFGLDLDALDPEEAGKLIARRSEPVELASYLDDWAVQRRAARDKGDASTRWRRLLAAARVADPHPWRVALRDQIGGDDLEALRRLADDREGLEDPSSTSLVLLAAALIDRGDRDRAERVLRWAWRLDPGDFWVNYQLGQVRQVENHYLRPQDAIRFLSTAVAIRPRSFTAHMTLGVALKDARKLEEATVEFRAALRLRPEYAYGHNNLGNILAEQEKFEESLVEYREAVRLKPDYAMPHDGLGNALLNLGKFDEAAAEFHAALRLKPDFALAHSNLAYALRVQGKFDEAIAESRAALRLRDDFPEPHCNLGLALRSRGELDEAVDELRRARDLARTNNPAFAERVDRMLSTTERLACAAARLPSVLAGTLEPGGTDEVLDLAQVCYYRGQYGASARFWDEAFRAEPKLVDDLGAHLRYDAACAAALAGCGRGKDKPALDDTCRARWRQQAREWLEADLAAWSKALNSGSWESRQVIARKLRDWKVDPDLAGLRDTDALGSIPEDEQEAWRSFWKAVDALLVSLHPSTPP